MDQKQNLKEKILKIVNLQIKENLLEIMVLEENLMVNILKKEDYQAKENLIEMMDIKKIME